MSTSALIRRMAEMGLTPQQMIELAEAFEGARPRSGGAERTRRWRERKAEASQAASQPASQAPSPGDVTDVTSPQAPALDKETPPAPPKEINPSPAITPKDLADARRPAGAGARSQARSRPEPGKLAEEIWALQPVLGGKRRAARPDVARALAQVLRRGAEPNDVLASCRAYYALPDCTKEGGRYAKGAADLLAADRWAEYRPAPGLSPAPAAAAWTGPKAVLDAVLAETDAGFVRSYLLASEWIPPDAEGASEGALGAIRPRTAYAFDKLARLKRLSALARLLDPSPRSLPA